MTFFISLVGVDAAYSQLKSWISRQTSCFEGRDQCYIEIILHSANANKTLTIL